MDGTRFAVMLLLFALSTLWTSGLGAPSPLAGSTNSTSFDVNGSQAPSSCKDIDECRTVTSIVWSCISTILLCTWTSLHLDIGILDFGDRNNGTVNSLSFLFELCR